MEKQTGNIQTEKSLDADFISKLAIDALEDLKAVDIGIIDVRGKLDITDIMIIASGTSNRHVKALANSVVVKAKENNVNPLGVEGDTEAEWILVDLGDVVVHVMLPSVREFYGLERLWSVDAHQNAASQTPLEN